jgi:hypothetical protein
MISLKVTTTFASGTIEGALEVEGDGVRETCKGVEVGARELDGVALGERD